LILQTHDFGCKNRAISPFLNAFLGHFTATSLTWLGPTPNPQKSQSIHLIFQLDFYHRSISSLLDVKGKEPVDQLFILVHLLGAEGHASKYFVSCVASAVVFTSMHRIHNGSLISYPSFPV